MLGRRVRPRLTGPSSSWDDRDTSNDQAQPPFVQVVLLAGFQRLRTFARIAPTIRLLNRSWRKAVDESIATMRIATHSTFRADPRIGELTRFTSLAELTLEKGTDTRQADSLEALKGLPNLTTLTLRGLSAHDARLLTTLPNLPRLSNLNLELPGYILVDGLRSIADRDGWLSLALCVRGDFIPPLSPGLWTRLVGLTKLSLTMQVTGEQLGLRGILGLEQLRDLRLAVPLLPTEVASLSVMHQLRSLILSCLPSGATNYGELAHLTQLTRLELPLIYMALPLWLTKLTRLRCLSLSWELSAAPGHLFPGILSPTLETLTLFNFCTPLSSSIMAPLTALQKLSLAQRFHHESNVGEQDAFENLNNISELCIRIATPQSRPFLPTIRHMHSLKSLYIEANGIKSYYIAQLARELDQLQHLTIGSDLNDVDFFSLAQLKSLQSLTLVRSTRWTWRGFCALRKIANLTDLGLYHCGFHFVNGDIMKMILGCLESLEHLGFFPVDACLRDALPIYYKLDNRVLKIDDNCKVRVHFDGSSETVSYL